MEQRKNKIHFFKEKEWILARWYKKNKKCLLTENDMLIQWNKWWENDFIDITDRQFQDAFKWVKEIINSKTMEQIKKGRHDIADKTSMPSYINKLANEKGYYIKKCSTSKHPLRVSGYAIFKNKNSKRPIYGKNFDLTIKQVREFLERR